VVLAVVHQVVPGAINNNMKIPAEAKELMARCYGSLSGTKMAQQLGVKLHTVRRWAVRLGLDDRRTRREQRIREAFPDGDLTELASELGMTIWALRKAAQRMGVRRSELAISRTSSVAHSHPYKRRSEEQARQAQRYKAKTE
jgi:hypothetical protein